MNTQRTLRVLLIDDTNETLLNLKAHIEQEVKVDPLTTRIEIVPVHIQLEVTPECACYRVKAATITELARACSHKFDYIFSDFAFIGDRAKNEELRKQLLKENREVEQSDLAAGTVLQCSDIKQMVDWMQRERQLDCDLINNIQANFLGHTGPIVVYTNSAKPFATYFDNHSIRRRKSEIRLVFPNATDIEFILMHDEFSITPEIMDLFPEPGKMKSYYSKLLSRKIESELQTIALKGMVKSQHNLRFRKTKRAFQFLTILSIALGAFVAACGEMLFHFLHDTIVMTGHSMHFEFDSSAKAHIVAFVGLAVLIIVIPPISAVFITKIGEKRLDDLLEP